MTKSTFFIGAISLGLVGILAMAQPAAAQYPGPVGSVTATTSASSTSVGESVQITCTILNAAGQPITGQPVGFQITAQPGGTAQLSTNTTTTNAAGVASVSLSTGATAGTVEVTCSSGAYTARVLVEILGAQGAAPPQAPVQPPRTGDGGLLRADNGLSTALSVSLVVVALALAIALTGLTSRHARS